MADGFHFHWGSPNQRGSEHSINKQRFDVELHIVHRNARYSDVAEAAKHKDGLAVIGVMFKIVKVRGSNLELSKGLYRFREIC